MTVNLNWHKLNPNDWSVFCTPAFALFPSSCTLFLPNSSFSRSLLPNELQTPTQSGALSTATVPSSGWLGRCGPGTSECAEEIGRPDRAQGWKGSIVCRWTTDADCCLSHASEGWERLPRLPHSLPPLLPPCQFNTSSQTCKAMCTDKRVRVQWLWLYSLRCSDGGGGRLDLINLQLEQHGKGLVAVEVRSETEWHKRVEISQGWNGKRRRGLHWLDYSAKHRRDWVRKWLRDLSLIVFFQKGTSQSLKSVTDFELSPLLLYQNWSLYLLSVSVRSCLLKVVVQSKSWTD